MAEQVLEVCDGDLLLFELLRTGVDVENSVEDVFVGDKAFKTPSGATPFAGRLPFHLLFWIPFAVISRICLAFSATFSGVQVGADCWRLPLVSLSGSWVV